MWTKKCFKCGDVLQANEYPTMVQHVTKEHPIWRAHCDNCDDRLKKRRRQIRKQYGNSPKGFICPICRRDEKKLRERYPKAKYWWVRDHDHTTGEFRGWLCATCNKGIGMLNDSRQWLARASRHLDTTYEEKLERGLIETIL